MKTALLLTIFSLVLVTTFALNESGARVAIVESRQQQKDEVVTGVYEGYKNQTVNMLLKDGTRRAYPFRSDKSLLRRISITSLKTNVTITVEKGIIVGFAEVVK